MLAIRKILVPTDLSAGSAKVLSEAQLIAATFSAEIDLLYVWPPPALAAPESVLTGIGVTEEPLLQWLGKEARESLQRFQTRVEQRGVSIARAFCDLGDPASAIVDRAARGEYDLVVMGTHGRTGLAHVLLGSVAEKTVRRAPCPVLTVRADASPDEAADPSHL